MQDNLENSVMLPPVTEHCKANFNDSTRWNRPKTVASIVGWFFQYLMITDGPWCRVFVLQRKRSRMSIFGVLFCSVFTGEQLPH